MATEPMAYRLQKRVRLNGRHHWAWNGTTQIITLQIGGAPAP